jgi:hypothetical protein
MRRLSFRYQTAVLLFGLMAWSVPVRAQVGFGGMGGLGGSSAMPRGDGTSNPSGIGIMPFVSAMGTFNRIVGIPPNESFFGRKDTWGASASGGLSGGKSWEHTSLGVGLYGGAFYWPYSQDKWTGNYLGSISVAHMASPRLSFSVSEIAGSSIGGYGVGASFGGLGAFGSLGSLGFGSLPYGPGVGSSGMGSSTQNGLVDAELFNSRTNFTASNGGLNYRLTERWTASASGGAAFVRRTNSLFSNDWEYAGGQISYQIDSRSQVGFLYQYSWMQYPNAFGNVRSQIAGVTYEIQLNKRTKLQAFGGAFNIHSTFIGIVPIAPEIADLLGTSTSYEIQAVQYYSGTFGASIAQGYQRSSWSASYWRGISPGNGLALTGVRDVATVGYSISGPHRLNLYLNATASKQNSVVGLRRTSYNYQASAGTGYRLFANISWNVSAGWASVQFTGQPNRSSLFAMTGFTWSPRDGAFVF